jgi:hypothetical protein
MNTLLNNSLLLLLSYYLLSTGFVRVVGDKG